MSGQSISLGPRVTAVWPRCAPHFDITLNEPSPARSAFRTGAWC